MISSEDEVIDPDTGCIYQGVWSDSLNPYYIKPLRLSGFNRQCIVTLSSNYNHLEVIQFIGDSWQSISRIPVSWSHKDYHTGISWTTGDLDNDSLDEIIVCYDSFVSRYVWNGIKFLPQTAIFPYLIEQVLIGDINNDGDNEFVFFCEESIPHERQKFPYNDLCHLCIAKWRDSRLNMLWDDSTKLNYSVGAWRVLEQSLNLIADVLNTGYNQLLVSFFTWDYSPTEYNLLNWNDKKGCLEFNKSFQITNRVVPGDSNIRSLPFIDGGLGYLTKDDTTFLFGRFVGSGKEHIELYYQIFKIKDDSLILTRSVFHYHDARTRFIDIDGKGIGLLVIWREEPSTIYTFRFYRL